MYYIQTADRLTRTATWLDKLEGGIEHLREVVIEDKLGICDELEDMMQSLVDSYHCEWKEVVDNPAKRRLFEQFVNTDEHEPSIELIPQRGQKRPVDWAPDFVPLESLQAAEPPAPVMDEPPRKWVKVGQVS
ncbi:MAG: nitrite reductase (NAD(P)H), partial [Gimesia chilikensis]